MHYLSKPIGNVIGYFYDLIKDDGKQIKSCDVVMVVIAKHDWNGSFSFPTFFEIKNIFTREVKLVYRTVSTLEEINAFSTELKNQDNKIKALWIKAHGSKDSMQFGEREVEGKHYELSFYNSKNTLKTTYDALEKDATIVLQSCSTGNSKYVMSIAEKISRQSKRDVFAPKRPVTAVGSTIYLEEGHLRASFIKKKNLKNRILNIASAILFWCLPNQLGKDITSVFRAEKA